MRGSRARAASCGCRSITGSILRTTGSAQSRVSGSTSMRGLPGTTGPERTSSSSQTARKLSTSVGENTPATLQNPFAANSARSAGVSSGMVHPHGQPTSQSSNGRGFTDGGRAVDGNVNGVWGTASLCSNGQGNCGNRNAVHKINTGTPAPSPQNTLGNTAHSSNGSGSTDGNRAVDGDAATGAIYGNIRDAAGEQFEVDLDAGVTYYVYTKIGTSDGHIEDVNLQLIGADGTTVLATNNNSRAGGHGSYATYNSDADISDATILVVPAQRTMRGSYQLFVSTTEPTDLGSGGGDDTGGGDGGDSWGSSGGRRTLRGFYAVTTSNLYHRTDCCQDRLVSADIIVSSTCNYADGVTCQASADGGAQLNTASAVTQKDEHMSAEHEVVTVESRQILPKGLADDEATAFNDSTVDIKLAAATAAAAFAAVLLIWSKAYCVRGAKHNKLPRPEQHNDFEALSAELEALKAEGRVTKTKRAECCVCLEAYRSQTGSSESVVPRMLGCGHSFCEACLAGILAGIEMKQKAKNLPCPACRKVHKVAHGRVSRIPQNYALGA